MKNDINTALIRWSVVCRRWNDLSSGHAPILGAFLSGWFWRDMGNPMPSDCGVFQDSFRIGYKEADETITIEDRNLTV